MDLRLLVKHGADEVHLSSPSTSTVLNVKQQIEQSTGVFVRQQKLIYKGKVLEDPDQLHQCKLVNGARIMLLTSKGLPVKGQTAGPTAQQQRPAAKAAISRTSNGSNTAGSSLLTNKLAGMAAAQATAASDASRKSTAASIAERKSMWKKTGIISLRDMQLRELQSDWLEGTCAARAADFSHNQLQSVPSVISELTGLGSLKMTHNCLQDAGVPWQPVCNGLTSITSLLFGNNQLQTLPVCLSQLTGLVQLGLQSNQLHSIEPAALEGMGKLEILQLQDNRLQHLPATLGCCSSMVALNASNNSLQALPDSLTNLQRLQVLAVDNNRITQLPDQLFVGCVSLSTLNAHNNPITVQHLRQLAAYEDYESRRQARAGKQIGGRVMADLDKAFSEGADVEQWQRWVTGPAGLGSDGSGRAGSKS